MLDYDYAYTIYVLMYLCIYVPVLGSQLNKHIFLGGTVQLQMSTCKELD